MADTMTVAEIESAIDAIETQGRYIALHGLPGACPSEQDCRAFESFMRSGYAAKEKLRRMATAIKQREQDKRDAARYRWLRDKSGRAGSPYIRCDDPPFKPLDYWITAGTADSCIDRAMAKESGNG